MQFIAPLRGEHQADYAARCHAALGREIPGTQERNSVCMAMCRQAGFNRDLEQLAAERFNKHEFVHVPDVPVFVEHTTKDKDGNRVVYDRNALKAICDRCNERIADSGDFSPLTAGHTPEREGLPDPEVLGYDGPFRLGMVGNKQPRWAIFADEYHHVEDRDKLRKLRRRSPEVWLEDRMEDRFLDPIAALGAQTPRLDMGMAYARRRTATGNFIAKYAAAFPSGGNTFVPSDDSDKYQGNQTMLSPEDINTIVEAVMGTELMTRLERVAEIVEGEQGGGMVVEPPMGGAEPMGEQPPAMGGGPPPEAPSAPPEMGDDDSENFRRYMAGECDDDEFMGAMKKRKENYMAPLMAAGLGAAAGSMANGKKPYMADEEPMNDQYSRRRTNRRESDRVDKLQKQVKELEADRDRLATEREVEARENDLRQLRYSRSFDDAKYIERATKRDKYGKLVMSRGEFDTLTEVLRDSEEIPAGMSVFPTPGLDRPAARDDSEVAKFQKRVVKIATDAANAGKPISHDEATRRANAEVA